VVKRKIFKRIVINKNMVSTWAKKIFGEKAEEYAPLLEELEKIAMSRKTGVGYLCDGLEKVKGLIKDRGIWRQLLS
jgi:hypothetical protein